MAESRDFKGVWIPREIYLDESLSWAEKILLVEIDSLDNDKGKGCFASNEYLAKFIQVEVGTLANMLTKLKKRGLVSRIFYDGRKRGLRTRFSRHNETRVHKNMNPDFTKKLTQPSQKNEPIYRSINTDNNKGDKEEARPAANAEIKDGAEKKSKHPEPEYQDDLSVFEQQYLRFETAWRDKENIFALPHQFKLELRKMNQQVSAETLLEMWQYYLDCPNKKFASGWRPFVDENTRNTIARYFIRHKKHGDAPPSLLFADNKRRVA